MHLQPTAAALRKTLRYAVLGAVLLTAPAHAAVGVQSDEALKYDTAAYLARADSLGADWVRVMLPYDHWHGGEAGAYIAAIRAAHDSGHHVMVTLLSWYDHPTVDEWAAYAREVEPVLAPYVDAWSPMNEPDLPTFGPHTDVNCQMVNDVTTTPITTRVRHGVRIEHRYRRAKHGRWSRTRHRWVRKRIAHHRHYRRTVKRVHLTRSNTVLVRTAAERRACSSEAMGVAYRKVWDRVAPILAADDGARLVMGETCPCADVTQFADAFYSLGPLAVKPDVFGTHYSTPGELSGYMRYAESHGMVDWETEWALQSRDAQQWVDSYRAMLATGVRNLFVYDTGSDTGWDTRIPDGALESIAAMP